jgi:hypothetical protein
MPNKKLFSFFLTGFLVLPLAAGAVKNGNATGTLPRAEDGRKITTTTSTVPRVVAKGATPRCAIVESKVQAKMVGFDNLKVKHMSVYTNLKSRLVALGEKLIARGIDISVLQADLQVLDTKIKKFGDDYAAYVNLLKTGQDYVCGRSRAQFLTQWQKVKAALAQVHGDAADIRAYYASTIKPELLKLKALLEPKATSTPLVASSSAFEVPADQVNSVTP